MVRRRRSPWAGFGLALITVAVVARTTPTGTLVNAELLRRGPAAPVDDLLADQRNALVQGLTDPARDQAIADARRLSR